MLFFFVENLIGDFVEFINPEITLSDNWLTIREVVAEVVYGIFWVGVQIYHLIYKKKERFVMYLLFALLAVTINLAL
jgi:hypothetical protein